MNIRWRTKCDTDGGPDAPIPAICILLLIVICTGAEAADPAGVNRYLFQNAVSGDRFPKRTPFHGLQESAQQGVCVQEERVPDLEFHPVGKLPVRSLHVDITDLDADGTVEILYLVSDGLYISPYRSEGPRAAYRVRPPVVPVAFSALPGTGWVALNASVGRIGMAGVLLEYEEERLKVIEKDINLWLSGESDGENGEGFRGQTYGTGDGFGDTFYRLVPGPDGLTYHESTEMKETVPLIRSHWVDLNGDGLLELCFLDLLGHVHVHEEGGPLWTSPHAVAASSERGMKNIHFADGHTDSDGARAVFFSVTTKTADPEGEESLLYSLQWEDGSIRMRSLGAAFQGEISGISRLEDELVVAVSLPNRGLGSKEETILYSAFLEPE